MAVAAVAVSCCCCRGLGRDRFGACPLCEGAGCHPPEAQDSDAQSSADDASASPELWGVAQAIVERLGGGVPLAAAAAAASDVWPVAAESVSGRGYGLVATRRISAGELIIAECPLFIVHGTEAIRQQVAREHEDLSGLDTATMRKANAAAALDARFSLAVAAALGAAGATEVAAFCELSDSFFEDDALHIRSGSWVQLTSAANGAPCGLSGVALRSEVDGKRVTWQVQVHDQVWSLPGEALRCLTVGSVGGAFLTNAVSTSGQDVACVYGLSSRINHSCRPNALVLEREGMRCIFAASAIEQGDEVCISYVEDFTSQRHSAMREKVHALARTLALDAELMLVALFRQQLFVKWGFWCTCQRCAAVAPAADLALALWCEL